MVTRWHGMAVPAVWWCCGVGDVGVLAVLMIVLVVWWRGMMIVVIVPVVLLWLTLLYSDADQHTP